MRQQEINPPAMSQSDPHEATAHEATAHEATA